MQVWLMVLAEVRQYGSQITPVDCLGMPFVGVTWAAILFAPAAGFVPVKSELLILWSVGLFLFWVVGWLLRKARGPSYVADLRVASVVGSRPIDIGAVLLACAVLFVNGLKLRSLLGGGAGLPYLATEEFQTAFAAGPAAHARALGLVLVVYLVGTAERAPLLKWTCALLLTALSLLYQVKYLALVPLAGGFLMSALSGGSRVSVARWMTAIVLGASTFGAIYLVGFASSETGVTTSALAFLGRHFLTYLFSGVLSGGEQIAGSGGPLAPDAATIFLSLRNIVATILGDPLEPLSDATDHWVTIAADGTQANVFTLFGVLYMYLGPAGTAVYICMLAAATYALFGAAIRRGEPWILSGLCLLLGFLSFGWFHFFFWLLSPIEAIGFAFVLAACRRLGGLRMRKAAMWRVDSLDQGTSRS
jgi:hypothetical protein